MTGQVHNRDSLCGVQYGSGLLPSFFSSRSLVLSHNSCSFSVDVVVGCVGVYGYSVPLISLLHCLLVFTNSDLQCSLGLPNVYLRAVLARNLVDHFLLFLFRYLLLHAHKLLLQCTLGLEDSFHSKGSTGLLNLLTETSHIGEVECLQWLLFFCFTCLLSPRFG